MDEKTLLSKLDPAKTNIDLIKKAIDFSKEKHAGQKRINGDEYFTHPLAVAGMVIDYTHCTDTIITALLHDTIEDTKATYMQIRQLFGKRVMLMVDGLSRNAGYKKGIVEAILRPMTREYAIAKARFDRIQKAEEEIPFFVKLIRKFIQDNNEDETSLADKKAEYEKNKAIADPILEGFTKIEAMPDKLVTLSVIRKTFGDDMMDLFGGIINMIKEERQLSVMDTLNIVYSNFDEKTRNSIYLIKVMDRMHNLETMNCLSEEKQEKLKKETIDEILPLAEYLNLKNEPLKAKCNIKPMENFRYLSDESDIRNISVSNLNS